MNKMCNVNKFLKWLCRVIAACFLTFIFFGTGFQDTYNACVIAFVFTVLMVCISFLYHKKAFITRRGVVIAAICSFTLSITSLVGVLTERGQETLSAGTRLILFLTAHTMLLGIVSLSLFIKLDEMKQKQDMKCEEDFRKICVGGWKTEFGALSHYVGFLIV